MKDFGRNEIVTTKKNVNKEKGKFPALERRQKEAKKWSEKCLRARAAPENIRAGLVFPPLTYGAPDARNDERHKKNQRRSSKEGNILIAGA